LISLSSSQVWRKREVHKKGYRPQKKKKKQIFGEKKEATCRSSPGFWTGEKFALQFGEKRSGEWSPHTRARRGKKKKKNGLHFVEKTQRKNSVDQKR